MKPKRDANGYFTFDDLHIVEIRAHRAATLVGAKAAQLS